MIKKLNRNLNILKICIFVFSVVIPAGLFISGLPLQIINTTTIVHIAARIFAIIGILIFSSNLLLAGRYGFLDRFVGGLEKLFNLHRFTGKVAYFLITFHIILISTYYFLLSQEVFISFISSTDLPLLLGKAAFTMFTIIIIITLYFKIRYEYKQFIHRILGVVLLIGFIHGLGMMSDLEFNISLRFYVITFVSISLISYFFRNILRGIVVKNYLFEVVENKMISPDVHEIHLKPANKHKLLFKPGQFIFVNFKQKGFPDERHPFSITSSVKDEYLSINPKISGDFTNQLDTLLVGTECKVEGPYGGFNYLNALNKNQLWIAGGIGITPFISMYKHLKENVENFDITLVHSISDSIDAIKSEEFNILKNSGFKFNYITWNTRNDGHLNYQKIAELVDLHDISILMCGPEPMINSLKGEFKKQSKDSLDIQYELFKMF